MDFAVPLVVGEECAPGVCAIASAAKLKDATVVMRMLNRETIMTLLFISGFSVETCREILTF